MKYQLHDSQINRIELGEDTITFTFSQGFWGTDEHGKMTEQLKNCKIVFEIDRNDVPIEDFISIRVSKKGGAYKTISLEKFMGLLKNPRLMCIWSIIAILQVAKCFKCTRTICVCLQKSLLKKLKVWSIFTTKNILFDLMT